MAMSASFQGMQVISFRNGNSASFDLWLDLRVLLLQLRLELGMRGIPVA